MAIYVVDKLHGIRKKTRKKPRYIKGKRMGANKQSKIGFYFGTMANLPV